MVLTDASAPKHGTGTLFLMEITRTLKWIVSVGWVN